MSRPLLEQLSLTINNLEQQAVSQPSLGALLLWHCQDDDLRSQLLHNILEPNDVLDDPTQGERPSAPSRVLMGRLYTLFNEGSQLEAEHCYEALAEIKPLDMARFSFVQEFGATFSNMPFYESLLQAIAARI